MVESLGTQPRPPSLYVRRHDPLIVLVTAVCSGSPTTPWTLRQPLEEGPGHQQLPNLSRLNPVDRAFASCPAGPMPLAPSTGVPGHPEMTSLMHSRSMTPNLAVSESGKLSPARN